VQSDDLVTNNIVARGEVGWDGDGPGVVCGDQVVGGPSSRVGPREPTLLVKLCPRQGGGGSGTAVTIAGSYVVDDRPSWLLAYRPVDSWTVALRVNIPFVGGRPCVPVEGGRASSLDFHIGTVARTLLVAHDRACGKSVRAHKPIVQVICLPTHRLGYRVLVRKSGVPPLV
jgi:hypothetical protein